MAPSHSILSTASVCSRPPCGQGPLERSWAQIIPRLCRFVPNGTSESGGIEMIEYKTGNILEEDAEALVNTVNCIGFMGRGIALQFKKAWPENFKAYAAACRKQEVQPGRMFIFETGCLTNPRFIINFPTKRHWRGKSRIEDN